MHRIDRCIEYVDALKKEGPLLGEEDGKALIGGNHELVCLNLSEVGIDGEIESQC